jgi:hypothetical protein
MQGQYRGDFTRDPFKQFKHFSRVLIQQGRVHLDADWNEQAAILLHFMRSLAADLIGQHGGPSDSAAFEISAIKSALNATNDFQIGAGDYYVDGILCEADSFAVPIAIPTPVGNSITLQNAAFGYVKFQPGQYVEIFDDVPGGTTQLLKIQSINTTSITLSSAPVGSLANPKMRHAITYKTQPDSLLPDDDKISTDPSNNCLVYLDVWERHVTSNEDESIREVGLGGPDTATRAKVVWQVKTNVAIPTVKSKRVQDDDWRKYVTENLQPENRGLLKARVRPQAASTDPCITSPKSQYRGAENQLYRVEIHSGSLDANGNQIQATFKWSRENGSVVFPISKSSGTDVTVENLGRDDRLGLKIGDFVETVDDDYTLHGKADPSLQVVGIDRTAMVITLSGVPKVTVGQLPTRHPLVRRWDHQPGDSKQGGLTLQDGAALIAESTGDDGWLNPEDGIQIQFQPEATYRTGDYWLIPARVATGDVEWPKLHDAQGKIALDANGQPQPVALRPHGVEHHYAPLWIISVNTNGKVTAAASGNCRRTIKPATT